MAIRKSIGAKVDEEYFDAITKFCDEHGVSKVELVLDGLAHMMGHEDRLYKKINELSDEIDVLEVELSRLRSRGFWARVFNKGV